MAAWDLAGLPPTEQPAQLGATECATAIGFAEVRRREAGRLGKATGMRRGEVVSANETVHVEVVREARLVERAGRCQAEAIGGISGLDGRRVALAHPLRLGEPPVSAEGSG